MVYVFNDDSNNSFAAIRNRVNNQPIPVLEGHELNDLIQKYFSYNKYSFKIFIMKSFIMHLSMLIRDPQDRLDAYNLYKNYLA